MAGPEDIEALGGQANKVGDIMAKVLLSIQTMHDSLAAVFGQDARRDVEQYGEKVSSINKAFDKLRLVGDNVHNLADSLNVVGTEKGLLNVDQSVQKVVASMMTLGQFVSNAKFFDKFSADSASSINVVNDSVENLRKSMQDFGLPGVDLLKKLSDAFVQNAGQAEGLENNFVALSAAAGDLDKVFTSQGGQLKNLQALTTAYMNSTADAADATGLSVKQATEFSDAMKNIPGLLEQNISGNSKFGDSTTSLIASMQLMTGTGRSQGEVIRAMTTAYDNLSQSQGKVSDTAQKGAEFLATISSVSGGLKLRFEDVRGVMEAVAEQFKFVGNETDGAARVLQRYTDALRETGLTSKASISIIGDMVSGISKLETGTKAFLSLRSGGPGGLQGAFQIDQLLRQGKLDQVVQMAERSLRQQTGGKIYTQAEAAQSPAAASQFMRQRQLLQSGAFGIGKGFDDEKATRLLESLGKGDLGGASREVKTGQSAVAAATKQGVDIQQRNNNELKSLNRGVDRLVIAATIQAGATMRSIMGTGTPGSAASDATISGMKNAAVIGRQQNTKRIAMEAGRPTNADSVQQLITLGTQGIDRAITASKTVIPAAGSAIKTGAEGAANLIDSINNVIEEGKSSKDTRSDMAAEDRRKQTVYAGTVNRAAHTPVINHAANVANAATTKEHQQAAHKAQQPQKIILEIVAPAGFGVKKSERSSIHSANAQSTVVDLDRDPGY